MKKKLDRRITNESDVLARPPESELTYAYDKRPSWKASGSGTAWVKFRRKEDGSLEISASEWSEETNQKRQVFVALTPDMSKLLKAML